MASPKPLGIYVHIPFCDGKCPYCDFYSVSCRDDELKKRYRDAVIREISECPAAGRDVDTIYFGGGTPLLLGEEYLCDILRALGDNFELLSGCEITAEINPRSSGLRELLVLRRAGFSRISAGAQSAVDSELRGLCRRHTAADIAATVRDVRTAGFDNLSLDIMLCIPGQDMDSIAYTVDFYKKLAPEHISAYMLKLEPGTPFGKALEKLGLPDDDTQADMYIEACRLLKEAGYAQYEISNFSRPGYESRHNLKYWNDDEYLGFGAAAHGFYAGRRYFHSRDIEAYISGERPTSDGEGGGREEYAMLRLRLTDGITETGWNERFYESIPQSVRRAAERLQKGGLVVCDDMGIRLTGTGFPVSNAVIAELTMKL